jgi:transcription elongation factor S-II
MTPHNNTVIEYFTYQNHNHKIDTTISNVFPRYITSHTYMSEITINTVLLSTKGDLKKAKVKLDEEDDGELNIERIQSYFRKKTEPQQLGYYEYETYILYLFGYKDGKAGTENKHEMPPPYDNLIAFGDILLIASQERDWQKPCDFTIAQYNKFYESSFGGFESVNGDEESTADEDIEDAEEEEDIASVDDEEDIADEGEVEGSDTEEEKEEAPVKPKKAAAKKAAVMSSGYQKQQQLLSQSNFRELTESDGAPHPQRNTAINRFSFLLDNGFTSESIADLEKSIYITTCKQADKLKVVKHWENAMFKDIYVNIQRSLMANMHPASPIKNTRLMVRLKEGELELKDLALMSSYEMYPEHWKELADRQILMEQKLLEGNKGSATDRFKCNRCGKRECTYYEMQTRSADEPMTIFVNCLNCGKRWRQ